MAVKKRVEVRMPVDLYDKIRIYAAVEQRTRNEILLEILEKYFKEINPTVKY